MISSVLATSVNLVLMATSTAGAATHQRRPGLWDLTVSAPAVDRVEHYQSCVGVPDRGPGYLWSDQQSWLQTHCEDQIAPPVPGGVGIHTICRIGPGIMFDMTGSAVGDFNSACTLRMRTPAQTFLDTKPTPPADATGSARWIGACPADLHPGDTRKVADAPPSPTPPPTTTPH